jgi:hypothetical protein
VSQAILKPLMGHLNLSEHIMAGYSGTPVVKKLGIKPGHRLALLHAPAGFDATLGVLPEDVTLAEKLGADSFNVVVLFVTNRAALVKEFSSTSRRLVPDGGLWVAWPKKAAKVSTDLTEDAVRKIGLDVGLVDNKVCAIDETWSGLRFVIRLQDRPRKK